MGPFATAQVVVLPFPFSDPGGQKFRPALLIADAGRGDWIACQITSNPFADPFAIEIGDADFASGSLRRASYVRPAKLFTANETILSGCAGTLRKESLDRIRDSIIEILRR
ncbi:MAG: type II toxin-antitoxin system PemK/MazF family toxin [Candidatus Hydrogenedentes bacterium]|nr:type II toxin-antitoxin system PemK/MazF family toxin [Candidatus Hydrogenedentota bacterium]